MDRIDDWGNIPKSEIIRRYNLLKADADRLAEALKVFVNSLYFERNTEESKYKARASLAAHERGEGWLNTDTSHLIVPNADALWAKKASTMSLKTK
jgi:hypothetical protein